jgi:hypothetical protein
VKAIEERFWERVDKRGPEECWEWAGSRHIRGYGFLSGYGFAHRYSWELNNNKAIPFQMCICHHCDNPGCVNPDHLFLGTQKDNMQDCARKGRLNSAKGAKNGTHTHPEKVARGEKQGLRLHPDRTNTAKLDWKKVAEIRSLAEKGISKRELSIDFGVGPNQVRLIIKNLVWRV